MSELPTTSVQDVRRLMLYDTNKKSIGLAYALWFFLGFLGGHRFYAGRTATGVMMLCLTGLSVLTMAILVGFLGLAVVGIWTIVDAFRLGTWIRAYNSRLISGL